MLLFFLPFSLLICKLTKRKGQRERKRWREREIELGRQEDGGRDEKRARVEVFSSSRSFLLLLLSS